MTVKTSPDSLALYHQMARIRQFEETILENFPPAAFYGTTHTYLGQEANAVGVLNQLSVEDPVFSNHRCHGHFLAYGGEMRALFAELMGKPTGVCGGRGGSQHLHWQNFYSNGILGGTAAVANGIALAEKIKGAGVVTTVFLGDGALGEGVVYESLNLAALWEIPILFVLENNHIAQTTPVELALAGAIPDRFTAFGIPVCELDSSDVLEIQAEAARLVTAIRHQPGPQALVLHTHRFGPHSKGDDTRREAAVAQLRQERDPLTIQAARLSAEEKSVIDQQVKTEVSAAFQAALQDAQIAVQPAAESAR